MLSKCIKFVFLFLLSGCVYSFSGYFPSRLKKVYVENFKNSTARYGIEDILVEKFEELIRKDGRLMIVSLKEAKLIVRGEVLSYKREPFEYDASGNIKTYKVVISAKVSFYDVENEKDYVSGVFEGWGLYSIDEEENEGIKRASEDLVNKSLYKLLVGKW